ncbi:hypothetical protein K449DRAFT_45474 [Hypoxylon sp. EC38]|nr:hypothetical protein K449DRAFT_45474 [Hypoxylon sp. EC38]
MINVIGGGGRRLPLSTNTCVPPARFSRNKKWDYMEERLHKRKAVSTYNNLKGLQRRTQIDHFLSNFLPREPPRMSKRRYRQLRGRKFGSCGTFGKESTHLGRIQG